MTKRKTRKAARVAKPRKTNEQIRLAGFHDGYRKGEENAQRLQRQEAERVESQRVAALAKAPRRQFWLTQNENGWELSEGTAGSVRGKTWVNADAESLGAIVDSLVA